MRTYRQFWSINSTWSFLSLNHHPVNNDDKFGPKDFSNHIRTKLVRKFQIQIYDDLKWIITGLTITK